MSEVEEKTTGDMEHYAEADAATKEKQLQGPDMMETLDMDEATARNAAPYVDTQPRTSTPYGDSPFVVRIHHGMTQTLNLNWMRKP